MKYRMSKRYPSGMYHYLGKYGNICICKDTNSEQDKFMFEIGKYMSADNARQAQIDFFKEKFPNLSDQQIQNKINKAQKLAQ